MIDELVPDVDPRALAKARESKGLVAAAATALGAERPHRERETMAAFIEKKREIFLVGVRR